MRKLPRNAALISAATVLLFTAGCASTGKTILPHNVPSLYGPTAFDMPAHAGENVDRCAAIYSEIDSLEARLDLPEVDEDKGIIKPARFDRGEIRRAYLMGLARGIPCHRTSMEAMLFIPNY